MIINDHDEAVNKEMCQNLVKVWNRSGAENVDTYHFPDELGLPHDCISIEQPKGMAKSVYSQIMVLFEAEMAKIA